MTPIDKAIDIAGGQVELAKKSGVSQPTVHSWQTGKKNIAPENVLKVCAALSFRVTPHELRPDVYPNTRDAIPLAVRTDLVI